LKLVDLAKESVRVLKECGDAGIRSDILAEQLDTPKRRVYDIIAVLKALGQVSTTRKFDGTIVKWIDKSRNFVPREYYSEIKIQLDQESSERKNLQVQVAELKEQVRISKIKLRRESTAIETSDRTEFNTTQLRVRALSSNGIKSVKHSGVEVKIETHEAGMVVDPSEVEVDEKKALITKLQRL
jgi:CTP-dependent riboflavin kinase